MTVSISVPPEALNPNLGGPDGFVAHVERAVAESVRIWWREHPPQVAVRVIMAPILTDHAKAFLKAAESPGKNRTDLERELADEVLLRRPNYKVVRHSVDLASARALTDSEATDLNRLRGREREALLTHLAIRVEDALATWPEVIDALFINKSEDKQDRPAIYGPDCIETVSGPDRAEVKD